MAQDPVKAPTLRGTLRQRVLALVGALVMLSLFGSAISLYRISEVNLTLDAINRVSVPLGRVFVQIQSDGDLYQREFERRLGNTHWGDRHWKPRPMPKWIEDVIQNSIDRAQDLIARDLPWAPEGSRASWRKWIDGLNHGFSDLKLQAEGVDAALEKGNLEGALAAHGKFQSQYEAMTRNLTWGIEEYDRSLRQVFSVAQSRVSELKTGMEIILIVVVVMSSLLLWLGERALRPLTDLARLAREITQRGVRKEDKARLPDLSMGRNDEVSQLAREFHRMATALLEREKTVETQKDRLTEQNRLLREIGELNQNILNSIEAVLLVTDPEGRVTQLNPIAVQWLRAGVETVMKSSLLDWPQIQSFQGSDQWLARLRETGESLKIDPREIGDRVYGGALLPLKTNGIKEFRGAILVLEDLTDELKLEERLNHAEKMAAVGRLSAQVAHEVRNPLHSIGLEAELAVDQVSELPAMPQVSRVKQSLGSILASVDRLDKITENYLKLSKLSSGLRTRFDLGEVLESALATYSVAFEAQRILIDWSRPMDARLEVNGDRDLIENAIGNLIRNSLQALQAAPDLKSPKIRIDLGRSEQGQIWLRIEDNGPGVPVDLRDQLFTPFFTTRAEGTGLGLSFVRKVVNDHGGAIHCLQPQSGQGALFEVSLPEVSV